MKTSREEPNIPGVVGRRSARLSLIVPITLSGTDADGRPFKENTWTISVNQHGGKLATFHQLADDDQVVIENPLLGRTAKARVDRVSAKRFAEDPYEVCVELLEPQNIWGVKLPPEDWLKEGKTVPGEQQRPSRGDAPQVAKTPEATAGNGGAAGPASQGVTSELAEHNGGLSQFNMAVNALSRFAGEAGAPPAAPATRGQKAPGVPQEPDGVPHSPGALAFDALQETIDEARSLRQELSALADRLQAAQVEVENLLARISPSLNAQIERSAEQFARAQLEEFKAQIERARKSSEDSSQRSLESVRQETQAEIQNAAIQARIVYKEESEAAAKAISVCVDSAVDSLNRAGDEAAAKLQAGRETLELSLKKAGEESFSRLDEESASVLAKFRAESQAFAAQLQAQVEITVREFSQKAGSDLSGKLEATVEEALELAARDFRKQAEDALELLNEGLRSTQQQGIEETRTHIRLTAGECVARVEAETRSRAEQALRELADQLYEGVGMAARMAKEWEEQAKVNLGEHLDQVLQVLQKQFKELTTATRERQQSDALAPSTDSLPEKQQKTIEEALGAFRSKLSQAPADQVAKGKSAGEP